MGELRERRNRVPPRQRYTLWRHARAAWTHTPRVGGPQLLVASVLCGKVIRERPVLRFEYVYIFWKPGIITIDRSRLDKEEWSEWGSRAVCHIPSVRANVEHEAQFPIELPRRVVRLLSAPDDLVLDCFIGSGTTAVAAFAEGRRYMGMDSEPRYVKMARERLMQMRLPFPQPIFGLLCEHLSQKVKNPVHSFRF